MSLKRFNWTIAAIVAGFTLTPTAQAAQIGSTFDSSTEGWTVKGNDTGIFFTNPNDTPDYFSSGGNPGGYIGDVDQKEAEAYFYFAPSKFLGDKSSFYNGSLSFDLKANLSDTPDFIRDFGDVVIKTSSIVLGLELSDEPDDDWTSYSIGLNAAAGWVDRLTGLQATESQMQSVLSNLQVLKIRGDWSLSLAVDTSGLDNVFLTSPTPVTPGPIPDPPILPPTIDVPEPASTTGILVFGAIGMVSYLKRKNDASRG